MTPNKVFKEREAAEYVNYSVTALKEARLYGPRKGHLPPPPHIRLGRSIRYLKSDLDAWLASHRIGAIPKMEGV